MADSNYVKGKWYEEKTILELGKILPNTPIHGEKSIPTVYGGKRKVDIGVNVPVDKDYIAIELKNENKPIGIEAYDQIKTIKGDINAEHCALIINNRPTKDLVKACEHNEIPILHTIDAEDKRIRPKLTLKTLTEYIWIDQYSYKHEFAGHVSDGEYPPQDLMLSGDKTLHQKICELWNDGVLDATAGEHEYNVDEFNTLKSEKYGLISLPADSIIIRYNVVSKKFEYDAPLVKGSGIYETKTKLFTTTTKEITIGPLSTDIITKSGNETIKAPEELNAIFNGTAKFIME